MTVNYEWDVEEVTDGESVKYEDGEVLDHWHQNSFADCVKFASTPPEAGRKYLIVLVRDDDNGRSWAYLKDGKLPEYCEDAYQRNEAKVPVRFHREVERHNHVA